MNENVKKYIVVTALIGLLIIFAIFQKSSTDSVLTLGQYIGLEVEMAEVIVTDADVENAVINDVVASQDNVQITDRPVRYGDIVNIDYSGTIDDVAFSGGTDTDYDLEIGSGAFIDGFEDQIIGMEVGQTSNITVTFPDSYDNDSLARKEAIFKVTINSISGKIIPDKITDAMIAEISETYDNVLDYNNYVRVELEENAKAETIQNKYDAAWEVVMSNTVVTSLSKRKLNYYSDLYKNNYQSYADMYSISLSEFITTYMGTTTTKFNENMKLYAESFTKMYAISEAIAKEQNITISNEQYQSYLEDNDIDSDYATKYNEQIKDELLYQNVVEFIADKANFTIQS